MRDSSSSCPFFFLSLSFCRHIYDDMDDTHILFFFLFSLWIFPFIHMIFMGYFSLVFSRFSLVGFFPSSCVYIVSRFHNKDTGASILTGALAK